MTAEEHLLLNEVVERQFGLSFPGAKKSFLESRLRPRLQALHLKRYIDYYLLLQVDLAAEVEHLSRLLTNNETYFFRETYQFEGLFDEGVTHLRPGATGRTLRALCAGCSSGEEPYTFNIFALESFRRDGGASWEVDAFDIDLDRLRVAREAVYSPGSLRSASPEQRERHFQELASDRWELKHPYRSGVRFAHGNILSLDSYRPARPYDAVFCRNVLIYFSEPAFHQAIANFAAVLRLGGLLFLGHSESLIGRSERFETVRLARCIAYRKVRD
jgi:chemotaxis protein methyltransferase CheR